MEDYKFKIGFASLTTDLSKQRFKAFIRKNKDLVQEVSYKDYTAVLNDGTELFCIYRGIKPKCKLDQLILSYTDADQIKLTLLDFVFELTYQIPEDYIIQYDIYKK